MPRPFAAHRIWLNLVLACLLCMAGAGRAAGKTPGGGQQVVPRAGDTLYSLARRYYGSGRYWHRIADANGLRPDKPLRAGKPLRIPAAAAAPKQKQPAAAPSPHPATPHSWLPRAAAKPSAAPSPRPSAAHPAVHAQVASTKARSSPHVTVVRPSPAASRRPQHVAQRPAARPRPAASPASLGLELLRSVLSR